MVFGADPHPPKTTFFLLFYCSLSCDPPVHQAVAVESTLPAQAVVEVKPTVEKSQTHSG